MEQDSNQIKYLEKHLRATRNIAALVAFATQALAGTPDKADPNVYEGLKMLSAVLASKVDSEHRAALALIPGDQGARE